MNENSGGKHLKEHKLPMQNQKNKFVIFSVAVMNSAGVFKTGHNFFRNNHENRVVYRMDDILPLGWF